MALFSSDLRAAGLWLAGAGVLVVARAVVELADPVYWSPSTPIDYTAVVLSTLAWVTAGWAFILWARATSTIRVALVLFIAGIGTIVSGMGNLLEDLFDLEYGELLFSWGGMVGAVSALLAAVLMLLIRDRVRWAALSLIGFVAGSFFPDTGGEFLSGLSLLVGGAWLLSSERSRDGVAAS